MATKTFDEEIGPERTSLVFESGLIRKKLDGQEAPKHCYNCNVVYDSKGEVPLYYNCDLGRLSSEVFGKYHATSGVCDECLPTVLARHRALREFRSRLPVVLDVLP